MTSRIVVGIDGSDHSARALEWAVARARLSGADLDLVSAYKPSSDVSFYGYHDVMVPAVMDWAVELADEVTRAAAERVRELAPELGCTATTVFGHPADVLVDRAEDADLLVVGRRGLGGAASALLGSVSNRLATHAPCPLVVVGEGELPTDGPVVVGVDESDHGQHALRHALAEAALRGTSVRAVTAYETQNLVPIIDPQLLVEVQAGFEERTAAELARAVSEAGVDPATVEQVVVHGSPTDAIIAQSEDAQLIVVGTHGKGLVRRVLLGSVSRQVLHHAERPVAVVDLPQD